MSDVAPRPSSSARYVQNAPLARGRSTSREASRTPPAPSQVTPTATSAAGSRLKRAQAPSAAYVPPRPARVSATPRALDGTSSSAAATRFGVTTLARPDSISAALLTRPASTRRRLQPCPHFAASRAVAPGLVRGGATDGPLSPGMDAGGSGAVVRRGSYRCAGPCATMVSSKATGGFFCEQVPLALRAATPTTVSWYVPWPLRPAYLPVPLPSR
jgi:hypothetical protein